MNDREKSFIEEYMIDLNGTQAAIRAGYSKDSKGQAWHLLQKQEIRGEIDRRLAERRAQNKITIETIAGMLRDIAEVEPLDVWDENGNIRPLQDMPPHARRAIKSIKRTSKENFITGEEEVKFEIELWDKKGAIELLGKWKKMFTDKIDLGGELKTKVSFAINGVVK